MPEYRWPEANAAAGAAPIRGTMPLRVFIGYDAREAVAYHVLTQSLLEHSTQPLAITPLCRAHLPVFTRPETGTEATAFAFTRFLVPWLCEYRGLALFMDCDMLVSADIASLFALAEADPATAVWCCQHDYTPKDTVKFLGNAQKPYPRKNWSSLLLFRADLCRALTPEYVNVASASDLHRLAWVPDARIGSLPLDWNWLVGEYPPHPHARNYHYTIGGPWFPDYADTDHADAWQAMRQKAGL